MKRQWHFCAQLVLVLLLITSMATPAGSVFAAPYDGEQHSVSTMGIETEGDMRNRTPDRVAYDAGQLDKRVSHEAGQADDEFTITLRAEGKAVPTEDRTDIILVLDNSNSMGKKYNPNHTDRVAAANAAIGSFLDMVQKANDKSNNKALVQVGLVTFGSQVMDKYTLAAPTSNLQQVRNTLPQAVPADRKGDNPLAGGTNTQAALEKAQALMSNSTATRKHVIVLSDGAPTFSKKGTSGADPEHMQTFSDTLGSGSYFRLRNAQNRQNQEYTFAGTPITTHATGTIAQANLLRQAIPGVTVSSIGIQVDGAGKQGVSREETEAVLKKVANRGDHDYYDAQDVGKMGDILKAIFSSEQSIRNGSISDPMGDKIDLLSVEPVLTASSPAVAAPVTVTTGQHRLDVAGLYLGENDWVTIRYAIRLRSHQAGTAANTWYATNQRTTLTPVPGTPAKDFPIPEVKRYAGQLTLTKTTLDGKALAEARFELQRQVAGEWQACGTKQTDRAGNVRWQDLARGHYQVVETAPPHGYFVTDDQKTQTFELTDDRQNHQITAKNAAYGAVTIVKTDQAGAPLAGAQFALQDDQQQTVTNQDGHACTGTTATDGRLTFDQLPYGTYTVAEIAPPKNYFVKNNATKITVDQARVTQDLPITNYHYGSINLTKKDAHDQPLADAEFTLYDDKQQVVKDMNDQVVRGTTDRNGKLTLTGLAYGHYELRETRAPKGYEKLAKDTVCDIDAQHVQLTLVLTNAPKSRLPDTGGYGPWPAIISGCVFVLVAGSLFVDKFKND